MPIVRLNEETVRAAFDQAASQAEYLTAIYRLVIPNLDMAERIDKWPTCNDKTWEAICCMAQAADRRLRLNVLPGGAWLNHGFSAEKSLGLGDWEVSTDTCRIVLKPGYMIPCPSRTAS
jgi:hypothetical protein